MYQQLLTADVVVADLSTYNSNAIYELGVRHALRPYTTITIAEKELKYPFDLNHIVIRPYEHLGKDIGFDEVMRMRGELTDAIRSILDKSEPDSPIYTYIKNLSPPHIREMAKSMAGDATGLLGAIYKRLHELDPADRDSLDQAIANYERGFYLKNDYYNGINLAYLLNLRASISSGDEAVADNVFARRVRWKVVAICESKDVAKVDPDERYWIAATLEEAYFGLGETAAFEKAKKAAEKLARQSWMGRSTEEQLHKLKKLLGGGRTSTTSE
jgi:hypothetical protein